MSIKLRKRINESSPMSSRIDTDMIVSLLKVLYAEEIQAWYQYYIVEKFMTGTDRTSIAKLFETNADDELNDHADKLLKRISELGGDISEISALNSLSSIAKCSYIAPELPYNTIKLLEDNIIAEECAIKHYIELADITNNIDYTTHCMAVEILSDEEEHLRDLQDFYVDLTGHEFNSAHIDNVEYSTYNGEYSIHNGETDFNNSEYVYVLKDTREA